MTWGPRSNRLLWPVVCACVAPVCALPVSQAQTPTPEQIQAWLDNSIKDAAERTSAVGLAFWWTNENYGVYNAEQLAEARERIKGKPEHPEAGAVAMSEEIFRTGQPDRIEYRCFIAGPDEWRTSMDSPRVNYSVDQVYRSRSAWMLQGGELRAADPSKPNAFDFTPKWGEGAFNGPWSGLGILLYGPFFSANRFRPALDEVRVDGTTWSARASWRYGAGASETETSQRWKGGFDPTRERAWITESVVLSHSRMREKVGERRTYSDWHVELGTGVFIATSFEAFAPSGRLERRVILRRSERPNPDQAKLLLAVPSDGSQDLFRSSHRVKTEISAAVPDSKSPIVAGSDSPEAQPSSWLKWSGWALAVITIAAVWLLWRGRRLL